MVVVVFAAMVDVHKILVLGYCRYKAEMQVAVLIVVAMNKVVASSCDAHVFGVVHGRVYSLIV